MKNKKYEDDDNVVIADMSQVGGRTRRKLFKPKQTDSNETEKYSKEDVRAAIKGSLAASLLIGLIYIVVFGVVILIMYMLFKTKLGL